MTRADRQAALGLLGAALGGVAGALVCKWLGRAGVKPPTAALGVGVAGMVGTAFTRGFASSVSAGAVAYGASELTRHLLVVLDRRIDEARSANDSAGTEHGTDEVRGRGPTVEAAVPASLACWRA